MTRAERIAEYRLCQPLAELERKWRKAQGRHSNQYYIQEFLDLCDARASEWVKKVNALEIDEGGDANA